jgi:hypothetical protein
MSSSPNYFDTAKKDLMNNGNTVAPAWWHSVWERYLIDDVAGTAYHAEDGACFLYEKSLETKLGPNDRYPGTDTQKPYMVVYGKGKGGPLRAMLLAAHWKSRAARQ